MEWLATNTMLRQTIRIKCFRQRGAESLTRATGCSLRQTRNMI